MLIDIKVCIAIDKTIIDKIYIISLFFFKYGLLFVCKTLYKSLIPSEIR